MDASVGPTIPLGPHLRQLARAMTCAPAWPEELADRAAWLRVQLTSFLIESNTGGGETVVPLPAQTTRARWLLEQCLDPDLASFFPVEFLLGATMALLTHTCSMLLAAEAIQLTVLLEATLLRLAAGGAAPCAMLPPLPLVYHATELLPTAALPVDVWVNAACFIASHLYWCGSGMERQERVQHLVAVLVPLMPQLVRAGHLTAEFAVHCVVMSSCGLFTDLDVLAENMQLADTQLLPLCSGPSLAHGYILCEQVIQHYLLGDLEAVQQCQARAASTLGAELVSAYVTQVSAAAFGELVSVQADNFVTIVPALTGALLVMRGEDAAAEALLASLAARQVTRTALVVPAASLGDVALVGMAWIAHHRGDAAAAQGFLDHAVAAWRLAHLHGTRRLGLGSISGMPLAALLLLERGQPDHAAALADEFVRLASWLPVERDRFPHFGICAYVRGRVAAAAGQTRAACTHLDQAHCALRGPQHWLWAACEQARKDAYTGRR